VPVREVSQPPLQSKVRSAILGTWEGRTDPDLHSNSLHSTLNMRKIESQMIAAIKSETDWQSGNTKVVNFFNDSDKCVVSSVFLYGKKIAEITDTDMIIFDGGRQSVTTKSRLNALCNEFCITGECVFQKDFAWYVRKFVGCINGKNIFKTEDFSNGYIFA